MCSAPIKKGTWRYYAILAVRPNRRYRFRYKKDIYPAMGKRALNLILRAGKDVKPWTGTFHIYDREGRCVETKLLILPPMDKMVIGYRYNTATLERSDTRVYPSAEKAAEVLEKEAEKGWIKGSKVSIVIRNPYSLETILYRTLGRDGVWRDGETEED